MLSDFFFFNDTATTEIYPLSLHDALPISMEHLEAPILRVTGFDTPFPYSLEHGNRSEEHTSELQSHSDLVCRLLLEKKQHVRQHQHLVHRLREAVVLLSPARRPLPCGACH